MNNVQNCPSVYYEDLLEYRYILVLKMQNHVRILHEHCSIWVRRMSYMHCEPTACPFTIPVISQYNYIVRSMSTIIIYKCLINTHKYPYYTICLALRSAINNISKLRVFVWVCLLYLLPYEGQYIYCINIFFILIHK